MGLILLVSCNKIGLEWFIVYIQYIFNIKLPNVFSPEGCYTPRKLCLWRVYCIHNVHWCMQTKSEVAKFNRLGGDRFPRIMTEAQMHGELDD